MESEELSINCTSPPMSPVRPPMRSPMKMANRHRHQSTCQDEPMVRSGTRTIYTSGRPPWYDSQGQLREAFVIGNQLLLLCCKVPFKLFGRLCYGLHTTMCVGVCGGSASGKTTVAKRIIKALDVQWVSLLSMDSFYKVLDEDQHEQALRNEYNFDHPDSFDTDLLVATLRRLKEGKSVEIPHYNFTTHSREKHVVSTLGLG